MNAWCHIHPSAGDMRFQKKEDGDGNNAQLKVLKQESNLCVR